MMLERLLHKNNPCDAPKDSWRWGLMCTLFPPCFCCAGMRGFLYGIIFMQIIGWIV